MLWRFTILNNRTNTSTIIDEPLGWDANTSEIKRDLDWHGILFTNQGDTFQFDGKAMRLLKAEYEEYGVQGDMTLIMEEDCGNGYEEFSHGKFMFKDYDFVCGDECYVKVPVETTKETKDLRNRLNQKVNLETTKAFDEVTTLPVYNKLPFEMELPSKGIFIKDHALAENNIEESFNGGLNAPSNNGWNITYGQLEFAKTIKAAEIGGFSFNPVQKVGGTYFGHTMDLNYTGGAGNVDNVGLFAPLPFVKPLNLSPIVNYFLDSSNYGQISNPVQLSLSFTGKIDVLNCVVPVIAFYLLRLPNRPTNINNGDNFSDYERIYREVIYQVPFPFGPGDGLQPGQSVNINSSFVDNNFILNEGDRFYYFISITERKNQTMIDAVNNGGKAFKLTEYQNSFFKLSNLSRTPATTSKVFAINETISRVVETITNNKLKAFSEYFGRTDSQPYLHDVDGCGSLEVISDGIRVRKQENRIPNKPSLFSLSLQDVFEGLNPIHNIGMGVETDPYRIGYNRLRVEPWRYFYNDTVILSCTDIAKINRKVYEKEIFSTFQFGYQKWEAEEYTGLDEFLTKRTYRTTLNQVKNDLVKLSKFVASGYALEITRRKGDNNSKDWRYDKDTFIICVKRNNAGDLVVELGNILNPQNIIDPATLYNYRISPVRNALRWVNKLFESYKQFDANAKLIFTDGDANYYAAGEIQNTDCTLEAGLITENQIINVTVFNDSLNAKPFLEAERIIYEYPMSSRDYKLIEANPYGLIYFSCDCEEGYGWIDSIQYKPEEGKATFNLIPKVN
jgi:hypothetical protein